MIQRVQSLYLFTATVLMTLVCFLPMGRFLGGGEVFRLYAWGIRSAAEDASGFVAFVPYMGILVALTALLSLVILFLYRRRTLQLRLAAAQMALLFGAQVYVGIYLYRTWALISEQEVHRIVFSVTDIFPLFSIGLTLLAFRAIARDEALVRSLDRIR
ncbi:MAG: DUF4293 domain-containing protein [Rikenellaceae bacterium]|jgi:hypothetical protein|nr:DUF4293 domain-containing protein [Rikenellaceae bacterium]